MADVFLSYSSENGTAALRLDNDLRHSRLRPWRYERDSRLGVSFDEEFEAALRASRVVCLLDSPAARCSPYVAQECTLSRRLEAKQGRPRLLVCLLEPRGRPEENGWWKHEIFPGLNRLTYIDLTDYDNGVRRLCRELGAVYVPGFTLPRDRDVESELFDAGLNPEHTQELIDTYTAFRCRYTVNPDLARAFLQVVIGRCQELHAVDVRSPMIALGVMMAEAGEHRRAASIFSQVTEAAPHDPRGWFGLAGARYFLGDAVSALEAYERCATLLEEPRDDVDLLRHAELIHNTVRCLSVLGRLPDAHRLLGTLPKEQKREPFILALEGSLRMAEGDMAGARHKLEAARASFGEQPPLSLILDLADCYAALGYIAKEQTVVEAALASPELATSPEMQRRAAVLYEKRGEGAMARRALHQAAEAASANPVYRAELASMLWQMGKRREARTEAERAIDDDLTPRQRYYRGLALHLLGRRDEAAEQERRSRRESPVVQAWPTYEEYLAE